MVGGTEEENFFDTPAAAILSEKLAKLPGKISFIPQSQAGDEPEKHIPAQSGCQSGAPE